jgi:enoyl-CoA hydratase/carnithine racemase
MSQIATFAEDELHSIIQLDDGKANALSFAMWEQLNDALDQAEAAGKVVIIAGRSGKFSAGFDLSIMAQGGDPMISLLRTGAETARRLLEFPTPVVAAASGHALAMGALLLLSTDYRIGIHGNYKIGLNEVAIGMVLPHFGVELARARLNTAHFNRAVGLASIYDAPGAVIAGYLDEAVEETVLMDRAKQVAGEFAGLDMEAHRGSKARVRDQFNAAMDQALERDFSSFE